MKNIVTFVRYGQNVHMTQGRVTTVKPTDKVLENVCGKVAVLIDDIGVAECERCERKCIVNSR